MPETSANADTDAARQSLAIQHRLLQIGAVLVLLGLISGFAIGPVGNPRMGLSAHLEGVMNGTFLLAAGAAWPYVVLGPLAEKIAFWSLTFGSVVNWLATLLAAIWGAGSLAPIAAPGLRAAGWQEAIVSASLIAVGIWMLIGAALFAYGLCRRVG